MTQEFSPEKVTENFERNFQRIFGDPEDAAVKNDFTIWVEHVFRLLGHRLEDTLLTEFADIGDFYSETSSEKIKIRLNDLSEKLGFEVTLCDRIVDIAMKLKEKSGGQQPPQHSTDVG